MFGGIGRHAQIGQARAIRCATRHTNREGPGGRDIKRAWEEADSLHWETASIVNAVAPVASATRASAETVAALERVCMEWLRAAIRLEYAALELHGQFQGSNGTTL
eukprot:3866752-Alexandrium_andersonii.AAC.1